MADHTLSVSVRLGLEGICADELRRLEFSDVRAENGRVLCTAGDAGIARANLNLRTGERVLLRLGRFPAPDFDALYDGALGRLYSQRRGLPHPGPLPGFGPHLRAALRRRHQGRRGGRSGGGLRSGAPSRDRGGISDPFFHI